MCSIFSINVTIAFSQIIPPERLIPVISLHGMRQLRLEKGIILHFFIYDLLFGRFKHARAETGIDQTNRSSFAVIQIFMRSFHAPKITQGNVARSLQIGKFAVMARFVQTEVTVQPGIGKQQIAVLRLIDTLLRLNFRVKVSPGHFLVPEFVACHMDFFFLLNQIDILIPYVWRSHTMAHNINQEQPVSWDSFLLRVFFQAMTLTGGAGKNYGFVCLNLAFNLLKSFSHEALDVF